MARCPLSDSSDKPHPFKLPLTCAQVGDDWVINDAERQIAIVASRAHAEFIIACIPSAVVASERDAPEVEVASEILLHAGKCEELLYEAQAFIERNVGVQDAFVDYEGRDRLLSKINAHRNVK